MGGGDLNLKKSWHPSTMKNMEKVWKAEQQDNEEKKRIAELKREIAMERDREEMKNFAMEQGAIEKKEDKKLDWMYKGPNENVNREEYLLGRPIDKQFEQMAQAEKDTEQNKPVKNHVEHECIPPSLRFFSGNEQVDLARKLQEDPLFAIKQKEMETRAQLLKNPVKLKQLRQLVAQRTTTSKVDKKKKKKKVSSESDGSDADQELDDLLAAKYKKLKGKIDEEALIKSVKKHKKSKKTKKSKRKVESSDSDDDSDDSESESSSADESTKHRSKKDKMKDDKMKKHDQKSHRKRVSNDDHDKYYDVKHKKRKERSSDRSSKREKNLDHSSKEQRSSDRSSKRDPTSDRPVKREKNPDRSSKKEKHPDKFSKRERSSDEYVKNERNSSDDEDQRPRNYGLMKADGTKISSKKDYSSSKDFKKESKESKQEQKWIPPKKHKLTEEEKERRRREMMADASVRDKERKENVRKYEEQEKRESTKEASFDKGFLQKHLAMAADQETVASRIKSNINNIQRFKHSMDKNFAKR